MKTAILRVLKPGILTTVQDLGRYGYQQYGISPSGAMDYYSMQVANILAGNPAGEAALEISFAGPVVEALEDVALAICGGEFSPQIAGHTVPMWQSFMLKKGQILEIGQSGRGARAYLAIAGGIDVPVVMGSKSTYLSGRFGGYDGRALQKGDIVYGHPMSKRPFKQLHSRLIPSFQKEISIRVVPGPHRDLFTEQSIRRFLSEEYLVTPQSNRMGCQLKGPRLEHIAGPDIISDPVPLGGIQVPASGQPIILLAERQTTGGYTRMGTIITVDIPLLAQAVPDTKIHFIEVTLEEAQRLYMKQQILLKHLALWAK